MRRANIIAVVLVVAIVAAGTAYYLTQDNGDGDSRFDAFPLPVESKEWRPATEASAEVQSLIDSFTELAGTEGASEQDLELSIVDMVQGMTAYQTEYAFFNWDYNRDPLALTDEYVSWNTAYTEIIDQYNCAFKESLNGPCAETVTAIIGEENAEAFLSYDEMSDESKTLNAESIALQAKYAEIAQGDLDPDEAEAALMELYMEIVRTNNAFARSMGYSGYIEYAYESYDRDYTAEDFAPVEDVIREYFADVFWSCYTDVLETGYPAYTWTYEDELLDDITPFVESICPEYGDLLSYMREYDLIDLESLDTKMSSIFTQSLPEYGSAYIFSHPGNDWTDVLYILHEFGHSAAFCLCSDSSNSLDIMEIQSITMEMLGASKAEMIFDQSDAEKYRTFVVYRAIESIYLLTAINELETAAYMNEDMTPEELNALSDRIETEYGFATTMNLVTMYNHVFLTPFYMLSYVQSSLAATLIYLESLDDYDAAVDMYLDIVCYSGDSLVEALANAGMDDTTDPDIVKRMAMELEEIV